MHHRQLQQQRGSVEPILEFKFGKFFRRSILYSTSARPKQNLWSGQSTWFRWNRDRKRDGGCNRLD